MPSQHVPFPQDRHSGKCLRFVFALLLGVFCRTPAVAQQAGPGGVRPRVALVLSGGSAKGFAHIGVIQTLEELGVPIDLITGTSMGGVIGGLYASGSDLEELRDIVADQSWLTMFAPRLDRRLNPPDWRTPATRIVVYFPIVEGALTLPTGLVRGEQILRMLQRETWRALLVRDFLALPIPFAAIATDIATGETVALTSGGLAEALRATIAVPGFIEPISVDGRLLVDGSVTRDLPAQEARELGAELLICSDVSSPMESANKLRTISDILIQTITLQIEQAAAPQRELCDVVIRPDVDGLSEFSFDSVDAWIERGRAAAAGQSVALLRIASGRGNSEAVHPRSGFLADSVRITRVRVPGLSPSAERVAVRALALPQPAWLTADDVDAAIGRLYATKLFSQATYRLEASGRDTALVFTFVEDPRDGLGFGIRYDTFRKTSLLFTGTLRNWLSFGSALRLDLRLGEETQVTASYLLGTDVASVMNVGAAVQYTRALFDIFDDRRRVARLRSDVISATGLVGAMITPATTAGLQLSVASTDAEESIGARGPEQRGTFYSLAGLLRHDTFNRTTFPSHGLALRMKAEWADDQLGGGLSYAQYILDAEQIVPLTRVTALRARATLGAASGEFLPVYRHFFLGGAYPSAIFAETQPSFWGLRPQERAGRAVQVLRVAVQQEVHDGVFVTGGVNLGNTFREWNSSGDYLFGWGASLGADTPLGPALLTVHGRSLTEWPLLGVSVGYTF